MSPNLLPKVLPLSLKSIQGLPSGQGIRALLSLDAPSLLATSQGWLESPSPTERHQEDHGAGEMFIRFSNCPFPKQ